ncbi:MAG: hypothetical protein IPI35_21130 [Deltaproteobacteria bacterium]|nr:hypothetical protein [Deltaproteobacteria bacterium]
MTSARTRPGNNKVQRRVMSGGPGEPASGDADPVNLSGSVAADGALSYYRRRHGDFSTRYTDAGLTPPTYYLGYGEKYVRALHQWDERPPHRRGQGVAGAGAAQPADGH